MTASNQVAEASGQYLVEAAGQAVPVGYKKTEVGVIPEDWIAKELGELITISSGESPSKFQFLSEGLPYFKVEQLNNGSVYAEETPYFINSPKHVPAGSVIFPKRGASILSNKIRILKSDSFMDTNLMALTCSNSLSELYLYNQLSYRGLDSVADTTSIPQINNKHIVPYRIPYPKVEEQTAIANALSDVDALIRSLEKLIAKKQAIKTATLQQLLTGRTRLPQFALREDGTPKGYKQSEPGEIPEDWEVINLLDMVTLIHGKAHEPFVDETGLYIVVNSKFISSEGTVTKNCTKNECCAQVGDVLMVLSDLPNGKALAKCFHVVNENIYAVNQRVCIYRTNQLDSKFLFYILNRHEYFLALDDGVTQTHILNGDISACKLFLPSLKIEQTAIATILSDMDADIQTLQQRLSKTRQIKQGMMQELLTGKIRLIKPEPRLSANDRKEYAHE